MMTKEKIVDTVMSGKLLCAAEWRSSKASSGTIEDEKTHKTKVTKGIVHQVEIEGIAREIREEIAPDQFEKFNPDAYNAAPRPFKKGEMVILHIKSFSWNSKKSTWRGVGTPESVQVTK